MPTAIDSEGQQLTLEDLDQEPHDDDTIVLTKQ